MAKRKIPEGVSLPVIQVILPYGNFREHGFLDVEVLTLNINTNNMRVRICGDSVKKVGGAMSFDIPATQFFEQMKIVPV
jgi:hypothetical protein